MPTPLSILLFLKLLCSEEENWINTQGRFRELFATPQGLNWHYEDSEKEDKKNIMLSFSLKPSTYASILLKDLGVEIYEKF